MAKVLVSLRIDEDLMKAIDEIAAKEGLSRTEVMEDALESGIADEREFVEALEKPLERVVMQAMSSPGVRQVIEALAGRELNKRRAGIIRGNKKGVSKQ